MRPVWAGSYFSKSDFPNLRRTETNGTEPQAEVSKRPIVRDGTIVREWGESGERVVRECESGERVVREWCESGEREW